MLLEKITLRNCKQTHYLGSMWQIEIDYSELCLVPGLIPTSLISNIITGLYEIVTTLCILGYK